MMQRIDFPIFAFDCAKIGSCSLGLTSGGRGSTRHAPEAEELRWGD
jgi:hypothetical protein